MPDRRLILIADDSEDDTLLLKQAFKRTHPEIPLRFVDNGQAAMDCLAGRERYADRSRNPFPRLLLLDLKMPMVSGFDVLEWVRDQAGLRRLPVAVLTSSNQPADINRAYDLGANSYIVKPTTWEDLEALVSTLRHYWLHLNQEPDCRGAFC